MYVCVCVCEYYLLRLSVFTADNQQTFDVCSSLLFIIIYNNYKVLYNLYQFAIAGLLLLISASWTQRLAQTKRIM